MKKIQPHHIGYLNLWLVTQLVTGKKERDFVSMLTKLPVIISRHGNPKKMEQGNE